MSVLKLFSGVVIIHQSGDKVYNKDLKLVIYNCKCQFVSLCNFSLLLASIISRKLHV